MLRRVSVALALLGFALASLSSCRTGASPRTPLGFGRVESHGVTWQLVLSDDESEICLKVNVGQSTRRDCGLSARAESLIQHESFKPPQIEALTFHYGTTNEQIDSLTVFGDGRELFEVTPMKTARGLTLYLFTLEKGQEADSISGYDKSGAEVASLQI